MTIKLEILNLVKNICDCDELEKACFDSSHPCAEVVSDQNELIGGDESQRQRPEPWIGNVEFGKVLFISSNPSISDGEESVRENFPTMAWHPEFASDFFLNRFDPANDRPPASYEVEGEPNFLTKSRDGEYRSGIPNQEKTPIRTWQRIHERAQELLGETCHPHFDYALTEVVHCKSKGEKGVQKASSFCADKWMKKILNQAEARVVVLVGSKVRENFAHPTLCFPESYGADQRGYKDLTQKARALRDIKISNFDGLNRLYVFNWHPTGMISNELKTFNGAYGSNVTQWLSQVAEQLQPVPANDAELEKAINELF